EVGERPILFFAGAEGHPRLFEHPDCRLGLGARLPLSNEQAIPLFLGLLSLGDIDVRASHPISLAPGIAQGDAARQNPAVRTIFVAEAILVFVLRRGPRSVRRIRGHHALALVGMEALLPFFDAVGNLMVLVAENALPTRRVINVARPQVPIPQTILRAADGQLEPFATAE